MGSARTAICLIGLRRSGKTTLGRRLAAALEAEFLDLDEVVAARCGLSCARILREQGEAALREQELHALRALPVQRRAQPLVLATGGGTPTQPAAARCLRDLGRIIHLELSVEEAVRRAQTDPDAAGRPLLCGADAAQEARLLHAQRTPLYRGLADAGISADGEADSVFAALLALCRSH